MAMLTRWRKRSTPAKPQAWSGAASRALRKLPLLKQSDGMMLIETAIVLPPFFLLLLGIFEASLMLTAYCSGAYAVRTGVRYGSVHSATSLSPVTAAQVQTFTQNNFFAPGMASGTVTVNYTSYLGAGPGNIPGNYVNVSITWTQNVNMMGYHATPTLTTQASRVILR